MSLCHSSQPGDWRLLCWRLLSRGLWICSGTVSIWGYTSGLRVRTEFFDQVISVRHQENLCQMTDLKWNGHRNRPKRFEHIRENWAADTLGYQYHRAARCGPNEKKSWSNRLADVVNTGKRLGKMSITHITASAVTSPCASANETIVN